MTEKKPKVLQVIGNLEIGGAQEVVRTLVTYLATLNCTPVVCSLRDGPLRRDIEQQGIKVEVVDLPRHSVVAFPLFLVDMVRIVRALAQVIRKHDVDVVQTHLLGSLHFLTLGLPYITDLRVTLWTIHNVDFLPSERKVSRYRWLLGAKRVVHRYLYRLASPRVGGFIAVSDMVRESMVRLIGPIHEKIAVICNGVDVSRYEQVVDTLTVRQRLSLGENARLLATVGTLKEQKGHRYLIDAAARIVPQHPDWHFLLIGDGGLRQELQAQVRDLGLSDNFHFLGNRHDVPDLLAASDLFVLPSLWEGLPMALIEAMAASKAVVATAVSGTVQVVDPNETGLLVPPGDSESLGQAIVQLLSAPMQIEEMGAAGKRRVEEAFSAQRQAAEHLELYRRLLSSE
jgi:glycosyltransferase involved in cell wall biosynthesis